MNYTRQQIEALWIMFLRTPASTKPDADGMFDLGEVGEAAPIRFTRMTPYSVASRNMKQQKLTRSELDLKMRAEAERLITQGQMPPLEKVLAAIDDARKVYRERIAEARKRVRTRDC